MKNSFTCLHSILYLLGLMVILASCEKGETGIDNQATDLRSGVSANSENSKVSVCHNEHIINVSINAVGAHRGHGDAIDMDGDGYFDIDNTCSQTDCDDTDPESIPDSEGICNSGGVADLLIGTWVTAGIIFDASVGTQSVTDYLIDLGLTPAEAAARNAIFEAAQAAELTVTLILYADNTYESFFAGGSDGGTWSLSADETTLTLVEGGSEIVVTINAITETTLVGTMAGIIQFDLDGDPGTPDVDVSAMATLTLVKS
jgi:hypothetical protein